MSRAPDLTKEEQANVRTAMAFLRARSGGWAPLAKALGFAVVTLTKVRQRHTVTPLIAFRVARFAEIGVDDLLTGKYPPAGACPHCGHVKGEEDRR